MTLWAWNFYSGTGTKKQVTPKKKVFAAQKNASFFHFFPILFHHHDAYNLTHLKTTVRKDAVWRVSWLLLSCCVLHIAIKHKRNLWRRNLQNTKETFVRKTYTQITVFRCLQSLLVTFNFIGETFEHGNRLLSNQATSILRMEPTTMGCFLLFAIMFDTFNDSPGEQEKTKPIEYLSRRAF